MRPSGVSLRSARFVAFAALLAAVTVQFTPARARGPAAFHGVGFQSSIVRDAARIGLVIKAVGTSTNTGTGAPDAAIWTLDGANPPARTLLPNFVVGGAQVNAEAITPDGAYVAAQGRDSGGPSAARVAVGSLEALNLNRPPYTAFANSSGRTISDDGRILYGTVGANVAVTLANGSVGIRVRARAARFDTNTETSTLIYNPFTAAEDTAANPISQQVLFRGASSDGSVVVGWSTRQFTATPEDQAFRYTNTGGAHSVALIPRLVTGGTWNRPLALSADGNVTVLVGNSTAYPNGEIYLFDTATSPGAITSLGSPNAAWTPQVVTGGITDDGAVVAVSYADPCFLSGCNPPARYAYVHNSHGWFHLTSALKDGGADIAADGWANLQINGVNGDGTLVFGFGLHDGNQEGFVAEFDPGYLANYNPQATPASSPSIVGVWTGSDDPNTPPDPANPDGVVAFMADGTYYNIELDGFERGFYTWDGSHLTVVTKLDTNGGSGLSDANGSSIPLTLVGDTLTTPDGSAARIPVSPGSIAGGWVVGNPAQDDSSVVLVLTAGGKFFLAQDGDPVADPSGRDGIEIGTYAWDGAQFTSVGITTDTNGEWGLSHSTGPVTAVLSADELSGTFGDDTGTFVVTRILVVTAPTPTGANVVVQPQSPSGTQPVTLQFDTVTSGGETTVSTMDPSTVESAPAPPAGFSLGDPPVYYEIETTAAFTGPVTICFNYGGIAFPGGTPRLLHYDEVLQSWVDITSSVTPLTTTICGVTSSFSPFAIAASAADARGFYEPLKPVAGAFNTVKGGSTVPLKFNIYNEDGSERTSTGGLEFSVAQIGCDPGAGETPVPFVTTGGTSLRYDTTARQFVQNWKTPKSPGCYFVRMTGSGVLLSALFSVK